MCLLGGAGSRLVERFVTTQARRPGLPAERSPCKDAALLRLTACPEKQAVPRRTSSRPAVADQSPGRGGIPEHSMRLLGIGLRLGGERF